MTDSQWTREPEEDEYYDSDVEDYEDSFPEIHAKMFEKRFPEAGAYGWYIQLDSDPLPGNIYYVVRPPPHYECSKWKMVKGGEKKVKWAGMVIIIPHFFWDDNVLCFGKWSEKNGESKNSPSVPVVEKRSDPPGGPVVEKRSDPPSVPVVEKRSDPPSVPVVPVEKKSVRDGFRDEVVKETRIGIMKKLAAEVHISGVSKYTLAKIEELRSLILQRI